MSYALSKIEREIEILGFNAIYYFEFGKNFSHPPERHDFWEMVYVDSGEIDAVVADGVGRALSQGQLIFHRPGEVHAHLSNNKVPNTMLVLAFTTVSPSMDFFDKRVFTLDKTAKTLLTLFIREARVALGKIPGVYGEDVGLDFGDAPQGSLQLLECYLTELLLVLRRSGADGGVRAERTEAARELAQNSLITLITEYMKENARENLSLDAICKRFFIGKSKLCQLFAESVGVSPIEYFNAEKIAEAKRLLLDGTSVSRVSDLLSYSSIHSFSRAFKKAVGISPTEYKKKIEA